MTVRRKIKFSICVGRSKIGVSALRLLLILVYTIFPPRTKGPLECSTGSGLPSPSSRKYRRKTGARRAASRGRPTTHVIGKCVDLAMPFRTLFSGPAAAKARDVN
ncbi:hypothetical protein PUN28_018824 [Cardiocondyla obscurior]|uniref:Secreted protein n=1 Tax=Cardiocondyla obscurior TaxID=286306 RepID=A0AAW2EED4_9HYME